MKRLTIAGLRALRVLRALFNGCGQECNQRGQRPFTLREVRGVQCLSMSGPRQVRPTCRGAEPATRACPLFVIINKLVCAGMRRAMASGVSSGGSGQQLSDKGDGKWGRM